MRLRALKRVDLLRHEMKALRYILDNYHAGSVARSDLPSAEDFLCPQARVVYQAIVEAPDRRTAERRIAELDLEEVDLRSFLRLSGEHYYSYPQLVRERAAQVRSGQLQVEPA